MKSPKYKLNEKVVFTIEKTSIPGTIAIINANGTFDNPGVVSYDILGMWEGRETLFKHVGEHLIHQ